MIWPTFYDLLGVGRSFDDAQLARARERALAALPGSWQKRCIAGLLGRSRTRIARAIRVLGNPERRARYDLDLWLARIQRETPFH